MHAKTPRLVPAIVSSVTVLALVGALSSTAFVAPAMGRSKRPKQPAGPTPSAVITEAVAVHNGAVGDMKLFATGAQTAISLCQEVARESEPQWQGVESDGKAIELEAQKDLRPYNKKILGWISALKTFKVSRRDDDGQELKDKAIKLLELAHGTHSTEFYEFGAVGSQLLAHNCGEAEADLHVAANLGDKSKAWIFDHDGLAAAVKLLGVKQPALAAGLVPYAEAGVS